MDNNKRYTDATEELTCLRTGSFLEMGFMSELEQRYQEGQKDWYCDAIRISSLLAALLLSFSYVVEWSTGLHLSPLTLTIRGLVIATLMGTYLYARRSKRLTWKYWVVAVNTLLVSGTLLLIAQEVSQPIKLMYYCNVFLVEVVVFTFIRLPLNFTNTLGLVLLLMVGAAVYLDTMSLEISSHVLFFMFSSTVVSVMVSIKTERMSRESFLKSQLIEHEKNQLRALNDRVNADASLDRVTRLMNRVSFEDKLLTHWSLCSQTGKWLVLVAVHIEHFAYLNEQRGAETGDDLLREIARKIRAVLVGKEDNASRISGGRFVVLLTGDEALVNSQLERLRESLSHLTVLERAAVVQDALYLSWGRVLLEPDSDRDPRGLLDRMFRHLVPLEKNALCCRQENTRHNIGGSV
ncbi:MAG: GGDEF domain-containing protein [Pseudomonadota bacterium]|nr:GGDEF domain-containing protein [Pseudomonadota bacterium]